MSALLNNSKGDDPGPVHRNREFSTVHFSDFRVVVFYGRISGSRLLDNKNKKPSGQVTPRGLNSCQLIN